ncbi:hypothetical protein [Microcoleus sp. AT9b-C3]|uniref:hypothetical protein n=2 Tax=Microcoleus TaxID=44471 RepID=UPI002FD04616
MTCLLAFHTLASATFMLSKNLIGAAGEYYVCAELCRRGVLALVTPKNNEIFDVLASDTFGQRTISIQVKTMAIANTQGWKFGPNMSIKKNNDNLYVVLVNMHDNGTNDFYIYKHDELVERVNHLYDEYMSKPKRDGSVRKEPGFRWFDHKYFTDDDKSRKNNWALLGFTALAL